MVSTGASAWVLRVQLGRISQCVDMVWQRGSRLTSAQSDCEFGQLHSCCLAFPHREDSPPCTLKPASISQVSCHVCPKFRRPEIRVRCREPRTMATGVLMPKTPMDKYDGTISSQHNVWASWQSRLV